MIRTLHASRRGFLLGSLAIGAGFAVGVARGSVGTGTFSPNVFVRFETDGTVAIVCNRAEMGQGVRSSLPVLIASELGASMDQVVVEQADGDAKYGDQNTDGSTSVRTQWDMLRRMGAVAREMLIQAAEPTLGTGLTARDHAVHAPDGRSLPFADLVASAANLPVPDPDTVTLRPDAELTLVGTDLPLVDAEAYVTGTAAYGADIRLPGMLTAVVVRPPDLGATVDSFDASGALAVPGVLHVLQLPDWSAPGRFYPVGGVAVVAEHTWAAMQGARKLSVVWKAGSHADIDTASEYAAMEAMLSDSGSSRRSRGKVDDALAAAEQRKTAVYVVPHLIHAPMETPAAVVWRKDDSVEVWASTQTPQRARTWTSKATGVSEADVTVHMTFLGAAFGRKSKPDYIYEAAWLSDQLRLPVRIQWTREDEIQHGYYHACAVQKLDVGTTDGRIVAWRHRVASPSITTTFVPLLHGMRDMELGQGLLDLPLDVPDFAIETHTVKEHLRIGWMRSVFNINHAFAIQSFVDELAQEQGRTAPTVLKELIGPSRTLDSSELGGPVPNYGADLSEHPVDAGRWHGVIDTVVNRSGFTGQKGFGFAAHASFLSYVALVVRVEDDGGIPRVAEAWFAVDAGKIINRDRVVAQFEGALIFGATLAREGQITLAQGRVQQTNFGDYPLVRMTSAPDRIHVHLLDTGKPPGGVGEPGVPPVAPAIANAWASLTGERVRRLPFRAPVTR